MLATARCVIAAAVEGEFSVEAIAEKTGLTIEATRAVLNSRAYQELVREEMTHIVAHTLVNGVRAMANIVQDAQAKNSDRIAAHRAVVQTYDAIRGPMAPPSESPSSEFEKLLKQIRDNQPKIEVTDASPR